MTKAAIIRTLQTVLDADHAEWVYEHRRVTIRKPLTVRAAELLARRLAEWPDPNEAADEMVERGWQGFRAEWLQGKVRPRNMTAVDALGLTIEAMKNGQRH